MPAVAVTAKVSLAKKDRVILVTAIEVIMIPKMVDTTATTAIAVKEVIRHLIMAAAAVEAAKQVILEWVVFKDP